MSRWQDRRALTVSGAALVAALSLALVAGCSGGTGGGLYGPRVAPPQNEEEVPGLGTVEVIAEGLEVPWSVALVPADNTGDEGSEDFTALVSERDTARILEIEGGANSDRTTREVARIDGVTPRGEGGLLGIAVHEGYLYAYFTAADGNRVERFALEGDPGELTLGDPQVIIDEIPAAGNHNGGRIAFGPDGMLYVTAGDAGDAGLAQDPDSLAGKILRLTPEGDVPPDNPSNGSPVFTLGHRNPQGIAWASDGTMIASEFGQNTWDELNVIDAGNNYGWPEVEGIGDEVGFVDPVQQWATSEASPSGIATAGDTVFVANLRGERLRAVPLADLGTSTEYFVGENGRLRDVVVAPDGALWVLTNNTDGRGSPRDGDDRILRIELEGSDVTHSGDRIDRWAGALDRRVAA
ncbi:PQQ-dependent sugar dehydrogenase [Leucobacter denitrificans]|uniref:PQQ-dependent sugar dehydrogenase n=2 Tax=Leucobacter denitrificans TaxID=683042 RepID=A0A7G9S7P5_9MICO|nr:PQQ-dependent sugar dehydrogenase [Leucobacter denitrificans]